MELLQHVEARRISGKDPSPIGDRSKDGIQIDKSDTDQRNTKNGPRLSSFSLQTVTKRPTRRDQILRLISAGTIPSLLRREDSILVGRERGGLEYLCHSTRKIQASRKRQATSESRLCTPRNPAARSGAGGYGGFRRTIRIWKREVRKNHDTIRVYFQ